MSLVMLNSRGSEWVAPIVRLQPKTRRNDPCWCGQRLAGGRFIKVKECDRRHPYHDSDAWSGPEFERQGCL